MQFVGTAFFRRLWLANLSIDRGGALLESGARIVLASSRLGGEEGAALASAFRDMVPNTEVHPYHWPIDELIGLFRKPQQKRDAHVEQMARRLERIRQELNRFASDPDA